jgi:hypothetical protein
LGFRIARRQCHQHADASHPLLLRARRERPCGCRAAERTYQFPPSDDDWHVTLPCEGGLGSISRREQAVLPLRQGPGAESSLTQALSGAILRHMKVEEIAEAVAKLPPDQLARFRRWFTAFEAGRTNHVEELDSAATKLGRLAGRAFGELKRRAKEP